MAELPDVGRHCALEACQMLDYTPHHCRDCSKHYCSTHRFAHGCPSRDDRVLAEIPTGSQGPALRPFACSLDGCRGAESIQVVCPGCERQFCLKHRHDVDHACPSLSAAPKEEKVIPAALLAAVDEQKAREAEEKKRTEEEKKREGGSNEKPVEKPIKKLAPAEQARADRITVMKLKMKATKSGPPIDAVDQMFLFVETPHDGQRRPIAVSKKWSIGRCVDIALKTFEIPNQNAVFGAKCFRFFSSSDSSTLLEPSDTAAVHLQDMASVVLRLED